MQFKLTDVRLAFPNLFEPRAVNHDSEPAYSATFIFPQTHKAHSDVMQAIEALGREKWATKWPTVKKELEAKDRLPIHDGESKAHYAGFEGHRFIATRSKTRPLVIDRDKAPLTGRDGRPYAGCYVNASIDLWAQDNAYGRRINAALRGVQFVRDGDAFGGAAPASSDDFELIVEEALV